MQNGEKDRLQRICTVALFCAIAYGALGPLGLGIVAIWFMMKG